jgi:polyvinyl alcohol dehydrogenase (cytochrome)
MKFGERSKLGSSNLLGHLRGRALAGRAVGIGVLLALSSLTQAVTLDPGSQSPDWPAAGHDFFHTGHNPVDSIISVRNVAALELNTTLSRVTPETIDDIDTFPSGPGIQPSRQVVGTVVVADGVAYFSEDATPHFFRNRVRRSADTQAKVIAMAVEEGAVAGMAPGDVLWTTHVQASAGDWFIFSGVQSAPVLTDTAVFVASVDTMYSLDRKDGSVIWANSVHDNRFTWVASDPVVFDGKVMVGVSSVENGFVNDPTAKGTMRQKVIAFDETTGDVAWEAFTVSDPTLGFPKYGSGAGVWSSPAIDPETGLLYVGTGQRHTCGSDRIEETDANGETAILCPGGPTSPESAADEDYSDSLIVIDVESGTIINHRQFTANDIWGGGAFPQRPGTIRDADVGIPPTLFTIPQDSGENGRAVVGVGDKAGTYYVMDRASLEIVWQRQVSQPSVFGGFQSTAAYTEAALYVTAHEDFFGEPILSNPLISDSLSVLAAYGSRSNLKALDPATGEILWERTIQGPTSVSQLVVADGLLYFGGSDGIVRAFNAETGDLLVELPGLQTRPEASPIEGEEDVPRTSAVSSMSLVGGKLFVSHVGFDVPLGGMLVYSLAELEVDLDIKPGSDANPINLMSRGIIPVAVLGSDTFDVADVDGSTLAFGPDEAAPDHTRGPHFDDVNGDGSTDLLAHFRTQETGIAVGAVEACITGELVDGTPIEGCDDIRTVPACGFGFELVLLLPPVMWLRGRRRRRSQRSGGGTPRSHRVPGLRATV